MVASVLPYVDVLTTDGYISELVKNAKLLDRFPAQVFSVKQRDVFSLHLRGL
jgi:hypothetical protein